MSKLYNVKPSQLFPELDEYTAFCFDEAIAYIIAKIQNNEEPDFTIKDNSANVKHYKKASDLYNSMGYENGSYKKYL